MRKLFMVFIGLTAATALWAGAIPTQITYQGTLKEKGLPSAGPSRKMFFRITNQDGTQVYWSSGDRIVPVSNGLFSTQLSPTGVDWQNVTPYIEVNVENQLLLPREPVASSVYALMSESVIDGSITRSKLDTSMQTNLTPSGIVVAFAGSTAPTGWLLCDGSVISRATFASLFQAIGVTWGGGDGSTTFNVPDLRGKTLFDKSTSGTFGVLGSTGGTETHSHQLTTYVTHNTGNFAGTVTVNSSGQLGSAQAGPDFSNTGATINTNSVSNVPPFVVINYIIKI